MNEFKGGSKIEFFNTFFRAKNIWLKNVTKWDKFCGGCRISSKNAIHLDHSTKSLFKKQKVVKWLVQQSSSHANAVDCI